MATKTNQFNIDEVDMELFISEVKLHPEIWNIADNNYHDRTKKRGAWIEICRVFCEGFDEKDERDKNDICKYFYVPLDNFKKSLNKTKSGQAAGSGRKYIYARQLSFLQTAGATTETQSSFGNDEIEEELTQPEEPEQPPTYNQRSTKKRKLDIETSLIDFMNTPIPTPTAPVVQELNPDRSFFESILPSISDFSENQKLDFRCEVLNIIKRMRKPPQSIPQYHTSVPFTETSAISKQYAPLQNVQQHPSYTRLSQVRPSENIIYSRQFVPPSIISPPTPSTHSDENSMDLFSNSFSKQ
ncbi:MADF domain-containing protein [Aphis craccivora]|uniref:MADF domain-containing protein n=1 Tax=Aphis craccivora TaxID=307492 RepID=A0A6G0VTV0_APHCR|nr:MADF domain-containing protein [Aphis craccivora]